MKKIAREDRLKLYTILKASYLNNDEAQQMLQQYGYTLDTDLSGERAKVFVDKDGHASVVYSGTNEINDVLTDVQLMAGLGRHTKRLEHGREVYKEATLKYGDGVDTYGHSLGGYIAENVGNKEGRILTYNKASIGEHSHTNQLDVRTHNDPVSGLTPKAKNRYDIKGAFDLYTTHMLDILKR